METSNAAKLCTIQPLVNFTISKCSFLLIAWPFGISQSLKTSIDSQDRSEVSTGEVRNADRKCVCELSHKKALGVSWFRVLACLLMFVY